MLITRHALGLIAGSLIAGCFSANTLLDGTQTGNPPVIRTERVSVQLTNLNAHVIGKPGTVSPDGATVEITNLVTGETSTTQAADDGSFDTLVGFGSDSYSVRAKLGSQSSSPVFVARGTAAIGDGRDQSLSCEQRNALAGQLLTDAVDNADRSCAHDSDCKPAVARASCYQPNCWFAYASVRGRGEIERVSRDVDANLCAEYDADGCSHPLPKCAEPSAAVCRMGKCAPSQPQESADSCNNLGLEAAKRFDDAIQTADRSCNDVGDCIVSSIRVSCGKDCPLGEAFSQAGLDSLYAALRDIEGRECSAFDARGCKSSQPICGDQDIAVACLKHVCTRRQPGDTVPPCGACLEQLIEWGPNAESGGSTDVSQLTPCAQYQRHRFNTQNGNEVSCVGQLDQCSEIASTGAVWTALQHPDVEALDSRNLNPVQFGDMRCDSFKIRIGIRELVLGSACDGASTDCVPVPPGVQAMRDLLQQIDKEMVATGPCAEIQS
jgi:hypothetical protein